MAQADEHYRNVLAKHYTWMMGVPFAEKVTEQKTLLEAIVGPALPSSTRGSALDLGSGPGFQSIALAQLGFAPVIAVDTSPELIKELEAQRESLPIVSVLADLASLDEAVAEINFEIAVCMGDTLTHLESKDAVQALFDAVFRKLARGGLFVITYRDLSTTLAGLDRFIPVRSDDTTVMTCFLEYEDSEHVVVNDIVYSRDGTGWKMDKSCYRKLRLATDWVAVALRHAGFRIRSQGPAGRLQLIVGERT